nr:immunoglobulin heavy chain junction region [Macaca mulatta]
CTREYGSSHLSRFDVW